MPQENATWETLIRGVTRRTGERHTFIIPRAVAKVIPIGGRFFSGNASVPHALPHRPPEDRTEDYHTLPGLLAEALRFAEAQADHKLLVAAHGEAGSPKTHGLGLSKPKAAAVQALLLGDRDAFIKGCMLSAAPDQRRLLSWADAAFGYGCTPPATDTPSAWREPLQAFRDAHAERFGTEFPEGPAVFGDPDMGALYDLLEQAIADKLEVEPGDLKSLRANITLLQPEPLACGNLWPGSGMPRRVDLLFFQPDPPPPKLESDAAPGLSIYRTSMYVRRDPVELPPEPQPVCIRMTGLFFDTNKCFPLPESVRGLQRLVEVYEELPEGDLLVVGHTDTSGEPEPNLELSLERAKAVVAYLTDDVDAFAAHYGDDQPAKKRWDASEDRAMLGALPDAAEHEAALNPIKSYQRSRGLKDDGICGPNTRKALIADYMALDGTTLPAGITPIAHGCGEHFPLVQTGDGKSEAQNRRVELFHFEQGVKPPPAAETSEPGSTGYLKWHAAVVRCEDFVEHGRPEFSVPRQKPVAFVTSSRVEQEEVLLASADPTFVPQAREQHEKRGEDSALFPGTPGHVPGYRVVQRFEHPKIRHDHGFLDDGNGQLDKTLKESPTDSDRDSLQEWRVKANVARLLRPDLSEAVAAYLHFLDGHGAAFELDYEDFIEEDSAGRVVLDSVSRDVQEAAVSLHGTLGGGDREFAVQSEVVGVGATARFPYPGTENWQKAIGGHMLWVDAVVTVHKADTGFSYRVAATIHAEDMYNFNPGAADIATGTPDAENGRFEVTGLGQEFISTGQYRFRLSFDATSSKRSGAATNVKIKQGAR